MSAAIARNASIFSGTLMSLIGKLVKRISCVSHNAASKRRPTRSASIGSSKETKCVTPCSDRSAKADDGSAEVSGFAMMAKEPDSMDSTL